MERWDDSSDNVRSKKPGLVERAGQMAVISAMMSVPILFAWDKATDASLEMAHMRNIDTAKQRLGTVLKIKNHFPTSSDGSGMDAVSPVLPESPSGDPELTAIVKATGFPITTGIAEIAQEALPHIVKHPEAQAALDSCEKKHDACMLKVSLDDCLKPHQSTGTWDAIQTMMSDKIHFDAIRQCSIELNHCESDLVKCVQNDVISQCEKCRSME